jgi:hypothetical protein
MSHWMQGNLCATEARHTLGGSINHFHETHAIVHYKLFAVGIFNRWIVNCLQRPLFNGWHWDSDSAEKVPL